MKAFKLLNKRPLLFLSLSIMSGTIFSFYYFFNRLSIFIAVAFVCAVALAAVLFRLRLKSCFFLAAMVLFFFAGFFTFFKGAQNFEKEEVPTDTQHVTGTVIKSVKKPYGAALTLDNVRINGQKTKYKLMLNVSGGEIKTANKISFFAKLKPTEFNRQSIYSLINQLRFQANTQYEKVEITGESNNIFLKTKNMLSDIMQNNMQENSAALGDAILTGDVSLMDDELLENFRYGGIAHIFSVSGLHIATLAGALTFMFGRVRFNKFLKPVLIFAVLIFFCGVCGFVPSAVRAAVMSGVFIFSLSMGERRDALNSLSLSFIIVTLLNPASLWDIGFRLSFTVVLFMILLNYPFTRLCRFMPKKMRLAFSATLSATLASVTLISDAFGYISIISVILNLLFVPLISFCFVALFVCAIIVSCFSFMGFIMAFPELILNVCEALFLWLDFKPFLVSGIVFSYSSVFFFGALITLSDKINLKPKLRIVSVGILTAMFAFSAIAVNNPKEDYLKVTLFTSKTSACALVQNGKNNILIYDGTSISAYDLTRASSNFKNGRANVAVVLNGYSGIRALMSQKAADCYVVGLNNYSDTNIIYGAKVTSTDMLNFGGLNFKINTDNVIISFGGAVINFTKKSGDKVALSRIVTVSAQGLSYSFSYKPDDELIDCADSNLLLRIKSDKITYAKIYG